MADEESEIKKVAWAIHHQAVVDCPECGNMHVEDLGEDDFGSGLEIECSCGCTFELGDDNI